VPDAELVEQAKRRKFTATYKLGIRELCAGDRQCFGPLLGDQQPHRALALVASAAQSNAGVLGQPPTKQGTENHRSSMRIGEGKELAAERRPYVRDLAGHAERAKGPDGIAIGKLRAHPDEDPPQSGVGQGLREAVRTEPLVPNPQICDAMKPARAPLCDCGQPSTNAASADTVKLARYLTE
jgi:hypothetical protein